MRRRTVAVVALTVALVVVPAARQQAVSVAGTCSYGASECDVPYVGGARTRRTLDVSYARGAESAASSRPAVLFVHGGGWWGGDKTDLPDESDGALLHDVHGERVSVPILRHITCRVRAPGCAGDAADP
jgi:acetyl esterase/lipase